MCSFPSASRRFNIVSVRPFTVRVTLLCETHCPFMPIERETELYERTFDDGPVSSMSSRSIEFGPGPKSDPIGDLNGDTMDRSKGSIPNGERVLKGLGKISEKGSSSNALLRSPKSELNSMKGSVKVNCRRVPKPKPELKNG